MKKGKLILVLLVVILGAFAFTNPSEDEHRNSVKEKIQLSLQNSLDNRSNDKKIGKALGKALGSLFGNKVIETAVNEIVHRDNYVLFSLTKATWKGEDNTVGIGFLSHVFVSDKFETIFQDYLSK